MARQKNINQETSRHTDHPFKSTPPKPSGPASECSFEIFHDGRALETPQRSAHPLSSEKHDDLVDKDFDTFQAHRSNRIFNFVNEPASKVNCATSVKRTPLAEVTQDKVDRSHPTSDLVAQIAGLGSELKVSKEENEKLRGDIVAYQDALHQADKDAGYF